MDAASRRHHGRCLMEAWGCASLCRVRKQFDARNSLAASVARICARPCERRVLPIDRAVWRVKGVLMSKGGACLLPSLHWTWRWFYPPHRDAGCIRLCFGARSVLCMMLCRNQFGSMYVRTRLCMCLHMRFEVTSLFASLHGLGQLFSQQQLCVCRFSRWI